MMTEVGRKAVELMQRQALHELENTTVVDDGSNQNDQQSNEENDEVQED